MRLWAHIRGGQEIPKRHGIARRYWHKSEILTILIPFNRIYRVWFYVIYWLKVPQLAGWEPKEYVCESCKDINERAANIINSLVIKAQTPPKSDSD